MVSYPTRVRRCRPVNPTALRAMACLWISAVALSLTSAAADRTTCYIPLEDAANQELPTGAQFPDQAFPEVTVPGWQAYLRLWKAHHDRPSDPTIRRYLGLPLQGTFSAKPRAGRSAPRWLAWRNGSYAQFETPHFVLYSRADSATNRRVLDDLERCYWVWTQMFFPLWEAQPQVATTLGRIDDGQSIIDHLQHQSTRLGTRPKLRIVLFRDAQEYQRTIRIPGVERSTGFYSDERKTTFLYAAPVDDPATRRHELVHQLFREATRSGLRDQMPGEESEFWLIEGIAGYFESLHFDDGYATVGGWDSPRLQFARFRYFVNGDQMPMDQLRQDGRLDAQQRSDIPRWYAHAIAQTHRLLDGGNPVHRRWVYAQLANQYRVDAEWPIDPTGPGDANLIHDFLSIDDDHIAANPVARKLTHLCLAGCPVTARGLSRIPPAAELSRLTLVGRSIDVESITRLIANPQSIQQLSLEGTGVDSSIKAILADARHLSELDLSSTTVDDSVIEVIRNAKELSTLWLTGTGITDRSIAAIIEMPALENVDLQRTGISAGGIDRLKQARPQLNVNPLVIQESAR